MGNRGGVALLVLLVVMAVVVASVPSVGIYGIATYNRMTRLNEDAAERWSQVENQYQRRLDLIPNIARTVNRYMKHEQGTLEGVIKARAEATKVTLKADQLTPETLQKFQQAQDGLSGALSRLMVTVEKYPDLKAVGPVQDMMTQIEGTENRIAVSRKDYNTTANEFNKTIKVFPANIVAMVFNFQPKPLFKAQEGAEKAPEVFKEEGK